MFTFYWLDGRREVLKGDSPSIALMRAGYGGGSVKSLDFFTDGDNKEYTWNKENHSWDRVENT